MISFILNNCIQPKLSTDLSTICPHIHIIHTISYPHMLSTYPQVIHSLLTRYPQILSTSYQQVIHIIHIVHTIHSPRPYQLSTLSTHLSTGYPQDIHRVIHRLFHQFINLLYIITIHYTLKTF